MAEWPIAAVLKTVEAQVSGGSNPSPSAINIMAFHPQFYWQILLFGLANNVYPA